MKIKTSFANRAFKGFNGILMMFVVIATLYPFIYILSLSLSSEKYIFAGQVSLFPKGITAYAYKMIFNHPSFLRSYGNTIWYTVFFIAVSLVLTSMTAYPLTKDAMPGCRWLKKMVMFTMIFSGGMIPNFLLIKKLGLYNSIWAITLPGAVNAWYVMIMMTYFKSIPEALEEAAVIDGLSMIGVFLRIMLPLSAPIIATMVLFFSVIQWNNWFAPLIYFNVNEKYPVILVLRNLLFNAQQVAQDSKMAEEMLKNQEKNIGEGIKYSAIVLTTVPFLAVYPFAQKYFIQGMMIGSVKG